MNKKTTDLLAEKVRFLLEIKPLAFNQFMKMDASLSIIVTMQMLGFNRVHCMLYAKQQLTVLLKTSSTKWKKKYVVV